MNKDYLKFIQQLHEKETNPFERYTKADAAVCFANDYRIASANLGFSCMASAFSKSNGFERFFYFKRFNDMAGASFDSHRRLSEFPIIAFSFPYEHDLINCLKMLDKGHVLKKKDNLLIAGGAAVTLNPEPFKPFFDLLFLGEADLFWEKFINEIQQNRGLIDKESLLNNCYEWNGVLIPSLPHKKVEIQKIEFHSDLAIFPQISSPDLHFGKSYLIDICRGCRYKCHFCAAGYSRKKPLYRDIPEIIDTGDFAEQNKIGLIGSIVSDHPHFEKIIKDADLKYMSMGISSLRVDSLSDSLLKLLKKSGVKSLTLAPEAGSDRLRAVCGKLITNDEFIKTASRIGEHGFSSIKLYFMIGLPTETEDDIDGIVDLCCKIRGAGIKVSISVSISVFTPKARTPFQFAAFIEKEVYQKINGKLRKGLGSAGIKHSISGYKEAFICALLSMGDENIGLALKTHVLNKINLRSALKNRNIDIEKMLYSFKEKDYKFPWDSIKGEYEKAKLFKIFRKCTA
ncbi:MAG: radical SAM protein [candidate division Zixibacteria bacterium]|nr:radical SAM protein [candidate division Zixibacteria bacterium]